MLGKGSLKKSIQCAVVGAAVLAVAGVAGAAGTTIELNIYGASAQFAFWNAAAKPFLTDVRGCNGANIVQGLNSTALTGSSDTLNSGVTKTTAACSDGNNYIIRYTSKASYDGILSLQAPTDQPQYSSYTSPCSAFPVCGTSNAVPSGQANYYRRFVDGTSYSGGQITNLSYCCQIVDVAASDVRGDSFLQSSQGCVSGDHTAASGSNAAYPGCSGTNYVNRTFNGVDVSGMSEAHPLVVPFGIYANDCVTITKCVSPTPVTSAPGANPNPLADLAISTWGNQCYDPNSTGNSNDCIGYYKCVNNKCAGGPDSTAGGQTCGSPRDCPSATLAKTSCQRMPIDNISRLQLSMIYSGVVTNWQDMGVWWDGDCNLATTSDPVYACMRHAGSGTQATFDFYLRNGYPGTGVQMQTAESFGAPWYLFNDGTGDMMKCINGNTLDASASHGSNRGGIGYADCDWLAQTPFTEVAGSRFSAEQVHAVKLEGIECKAAKVRNCEYPLYTTERMYWTTNDSHKTGLIADLVTFAGNPATLNRPEMGIEGMYWVTGTEMQCARDPLGFDYAPVPAWQGGVQTRLP